MSKGRDRALRKKKGRLAFVMEMPRNGLGCSIYNSGSNHRALNGERMKAKDKTKQARDVAYWSELAFLCFTEDLLKMMGDSVSQAGLARRVGVSRGYISRVFRGVENLTLETMTKLALAVGGSVRLHVAPQNRVTRWQDVASVKGEIADESMARGGAGASERSGRMFADAGPSKARHHK
jgi:plasmid maintenance system antidote protein VapI